MKRAVFEFWFWSHDDGDKWEWEWLGLKSESRSRPNGLLELEEICQALFTFDEDGVW